MIVFFILISTVTTKAKEEINHTDSLQEKVTISDSIAGKDTVPDSVAQKDTITDSLARKDTVLDSVARKDTVPDSVAQKDTITDSLARKDTVPDSVAQKDTVTDSVARKDTVPDSVAQKDTVQDSIDRKDIVPDSVAQKDKITDSVAQKDTVPDSVARRAFDDIASKWNEYVNQKLAETKNSQKKNTKKEKRVITYKKFGPDRDYVEEKLAEIIARHGTEDEEQNSKAAYYRAQGVIWDEYIKKKLAEEEIGFRTHNKDGSGKEFISDKQQVAERNVEQEQNGKVNYYESYDSLRNNVKQKIAEDTTRSEKYLNEQTMGGLLEYVKQKLAENKTQLKTDNQEGEKAPKNPEHIVQKPAKQKVTRTHNIQNIQKYLIKDPGFLEFVKKKLAEKKTLIKTDNKEEITKGPNIELANPKKETEKESSTKAPEEFNIKDYVRIKIGDVQDEFKRMHQE